MMPYTFVMKGAATLEQAEEWKREFERRAKQRDPTVEVEFVRPRCAADGSFVVHGKVTTARERAA